MSTPYYIVVEKFASAPKAGVAFGDYVRKVAFDEARYLRHDAKREGHKDVTYTLVKCPEDTQAAIDAEVAKFHTN